VVALKKARETWPLSMPMLDSRRVRFMAVVVTWPLKSKHAIVGTTMTSARVRGNKAFLPHQAGPR
jgi:hypothetical protein